jgi:hypothetical protein
MWFYHPLLLFLLQVYAHCSNIYSKNIGSFCLTLFSDELVMVSCESCALDLILLLD